MLLDLKCRVRFLAPPLLSDNEVWAAERAAFFFSAVEFYWPLAPPLWQGIVLTQKVGKLNLEPHLPTGDFMVFNDGKRPTNPSLGKEAFNQPCEIFKISVHSLPQFDARNC